jgi:hypothetical protein
MEKLARKNDIDYDERDYESEPGEGNGDLQNYSVLLLPFYDKNEGVKSFFEQLMKTHNKRLLYSTFILMLTNGQAVPDSLFMNFAKQDEYRSRLYADLEKIKKLDKFPAAYKNQQDIARSLLLDEETIGLKPDSIVFVDKLAITYENKKGWVYFFKYKQQRDDDFWQLEASGMQPEDLTAIDIHNKKFMDANHKLENDKPVSEQIQRMLHEMLYSKHQSASAFYEAGPFNVYKSYLSEMVKQRRYKD